MMESDLRLNYDINKLTGLPLEEKEKISLEMIGVSMREARNPWVSFSGGKKSLVLLHLVKRCNSGKINVLHADTTVEFDNIINYIDKMRRLWGFNLLKACADNININIAENKIECCKQLILDPIGKAVEDHKIDCIYIGTTYGEERLDWSVIEEKGARPANPIQHFLEEDIWEYIKKYNLPHCSLYREGYLNLDCKPCSGLGEEKKIQANNQDEARIRESFRRLGYL